MDRDARRSETNGSADQWFEDYQEEEEEGFEIGEYDLTSTPNDFNIATIYNFIESGAVKIPGFQRNFVWDQPRASKLIESLLLGLPVPQLFLYEEERNRFLVIDGQQRLMSIYYFIKQRFPLPEKRVELRTVFDQMGNIPEHLLRDDDYFVDFHLKLPARYHDRPSIFQGMTYSTLGPYKTQFDLRPVRLVVVKQNVPPEDDSSIYEIFNRLNTGGINLRPQEIRASMYHSAFYDMLVRLNTNPQWRHLLGTPGPDLHMKDVEVLLRSFALLISGADYAPSMVRFLNQFSRRCKSHTEDQNAYLKRLFLAFVERSRSLPDGVFTNPTNRRFGIALFESTFTALCKSAFSRQSEDVTTPSAAKIRELQNNAEFVQATQSRTTDTANVRRRLTLAEQILLSDL